MFPMLFAVCLLLFPFGLSTWPPECLCTCLAVIHSHLYPIATSLEVNTNLKYVWHCKSQIVFWYSMTAQTNIYLFSTFCVIAHLGYKIGIKIGLFIRKIFSNVYIWWRCQSYRINTFFTFFWPAWAPLVEWNPIRNDLQQTYSSSHGETEGMSWIRHI